MIGELVDEVARDEARVLGGLFDFVSGSEGQSDGWARPMDVEPYCSPILMRLVLRGAAAVKQRGADGPGYVGRYDRRGKRRGSRLFRVTLAGATEVAEHRLASRRACLPARNERIAAMRERNEARDAVALAIVLSWPEPVRR